jgi:hypothetical protein
MYIKINIYINNTYYLNTNFLLCLDVILLMHLILLEFNLLIKSCSIFFLISSFSISVLKTHILKCLATSLFSYFLYGIKFVI